MAHSATEANGTLRVHREQSDPQNLDDIAVFRDDDRAENTPYYYRDGEKLRFTHRGRHYSLYQQKLAGPYYVKIQRNGFRKQTSTQTNEPEHAVRIAVDLIDQFLYDAPRQMSTEPRSFAKLGTLTKTYYTIGLKHGLKEKTLLDNIAALKRIVGKRSGFPTTPVSHLCGKVIRDFYDAEMEQVLGQGEEARQKALRGIKQALSKARSIFKTAYLHRYEDVGLYVGDIQPFLKEPVEAPVVYEHEPVDTKIIEGLEAKLKANKEAQPEFWAAYLLAKATLRRGEINRAKWDWIDHTDGKNPVIKISADQKGKRPTTTPIDPEVFKELQWWWKVTGDKEYIIPENGFPSARAGKTLMDLDNWFRQNGLDTDHTFHELRAHTLHLVREKYGEEVARRVARHKSVTTTVRHYAGEKKLPEKFSIK